MIHCPAFATTGVACGACLSQATECPSIWLLLMGLVPRCGAHLTVGAHCVATSNSSLCGTDFSLDNCGIFGYDDVYEVCDGPFRKPGEPKADSTFDTATRIEPPPINHVDGLTLDENGNTVLVAAVVGACMGVAVITIGVWCCYLYRRKRKRRELAREAEKRALPTLASQGEYSATSEFRRAEALAHQQRARIRARERTERAQKEPAAAGASAAPPHSMPKILCLGAIDPLTGAIQQGSFAGRIITVDRRSSTDSEAHEGSERAETDSPMQAARDWLSRKMRRALKREAAAGGDGDGAAADAVDVSARLARVRDDAHRRAMPPAARIAPSAETAAGEHVSRV